MAMEIKTLEVKNEDENDTIEFWSQFGWTLKSSQRIYNKDTHLESRGDSTYSVTETVDFTKLVFERDKNGPNYHRIVELEREYFAIAAALPKEKPTVRVSYPDAKTWAAQTKPNLRTAGAKALGVISIVFGFLVPFYAATLLLEQPILGLLASVVVGVAAIIVNKVLKNKALNAALTDPTSVAHERINIEFNEYVQRQGKEATALAEYNKNMKRVEEVLDELDTLI